MAGARRRGVLVTSLNWRPEKFHVQELRSATSSPRLRNAMSIRTTRQDAERRPVPSLQIMPRLEPAGPWRRRVAAHAARRGSARRADRAACGARGCAPPCSCSLHRARRQPGRASPRRPAGISVGCCRATRGVMSALAQIGLAPGARRPARGIALAVRARLPRAPPRRTAPTAVVQAAPAPHYLSSADLTSLADGTSGYQPACLSRSRLQSTVGAALRHSRGACSPRSNTSRAATSTRPPAPRPRPSDRSASQVQTAGRVAVNARVLAHAAAAAAQPSAELVLDAKRLAAGWRDAEFGAGRHHLHERHRRRRRRRS